LTERRKGEILDDDEDDSSKKKVQRDERGDKFSLLPCRSPLSPKGENAIRRERRACPTLFLAIRGKLEEAIEE
jgi:hypothetical protein